MKILELQNQFRELVAQIHNEIKADGARVILIRISTRPRQIPCA